MTGRPLLLAKFLALSILLCRCGGLASPGGSGAVSADVVAPPPGVPDRDDDPAVVAIEVTGRAVCAGALVASDVVVTGHRCLAITEAHPTCPDGAARIVGEPDPTGLRVLVGDDLATAEERARARAVLAPPGDPQCGADLALVELDVPIDDLRPFSVRATGAAVGDHVRTVGLGGLVGSSSLRKLVRDHVLVRAADPTRLWMDEGCYAAGGPAIDESSGEILGIASAGPGPSCAGGPSVAEYTRTDAYLSFVREVVSASPPPSGTLAAELRVKKGPVDVGANCALATDCAAGVCVKDQAQEYCSRVCSAGDRCPAHFKCKRSDSGRSVCAK